MKFLDVYKKEVKEIINRTYGNGISEETVDSILNNIVENRKYNPIVNLRNLYKFIPNFKIPVNDMLDIVEEKKLNILANGLFTESYDNVVSPVSKILIDWTAKRKLFKNRELEEMEKGNIDLSREFSNKQNKVKMDTNSIYGVSTMGINYCSNIDIGSAITASARNYISEMMWSIEKFLASNMVFKNINELYQYINVTCKKQFTEEDLKCISYIPTVKDCLKWFIRISQDIPNFRKNTKNMTKSMYMLFTNMSDNERIAFYYTDNIYEFISRNTIIYELFKDFIFGNNIEFINPYEIPEELNIILNKIINYFDVFVFQNTSTYDRVNKYESRKRKSVLISDTDSVMPCLAEFLHNILDMFDRQDLFHDDDISIKIVNLCVSIITSLMDKESIMFAKACNGSEKYMDRLKMKNEFYFSQLVMFTTVKKNYVAWKVLREGKVVPEDSRLSITGRAFGASGLNKEVSEQMEDLLVEYIMKSHEIDPYDIAKGVAKIRESIENKILNGDITYGIFGRFNGVDKVKNVETVANARSSLIWNRLYPEDEIIPGDGIYTFNTTLRTIDDINKIDDKYNDIKIKIRDLIFNVYNKDNRFVGQDFERFGLTSFAVPAEGDTQKIPEWIIPFIDVNKLIDKHTQPLIALYPSFGLANSKTFAKKYTSAPLLQL